MINYDRDVYRKIPIVDALKVTAIITIFFHHSYLLFDTQGSNLTRIIECFHRYGDIAVTAFFILSGFTLAIRYQNIFRTIDLRAYLRFVKKRIMTLYPLHLITLCLSLPVTDSLYPIQEGIKKLVMNIFLIHIYIPIDRHFFSFNSLSWYVASLMMMYLLFPVAISLIHKLKLAKLSGFMAILCLTWVVSFLASDYCSTDPNAYWILYILPVGRFFNFLSGISAGLIYTKLIVNNSVYIPGDRMEIISLIVFIFGLALIPFIPAVYLYSFYLMPVFTIFLIFFSLHRGRLSKLAGCRLISVSAAMVYPFFMFHQLVIRYVIRFLPQLTNTVDSLCLSFVISLGLSYVYLMLPKLSVQILKSKKQTGV